MVGRIRPMLRFNRESFICRSARPLRCSPVIDLNAGCGGGDSHRDAAGPGQPKHVAQFSGIIQTKVVIKRRRRFVKAARSSEIHLGAGNVANLAGWRVCRICRQVLICGDLQFVARPRVAAVKVPVAVVGKIHQRLCVGGAGHIQRQGGGRGHGEGRADLAATWQPR